MAKPSVTYSQKLKALRTEMKNRNLDAYIIPRADEFQGEFVAPYAERLKWLTGFTGSGGVALVFVKKAFVLTDGRYLIQVESQVDNALYETGEYVKKNAAIWLAENLEEGSVVGYDPYLHTPKQIEAFEQECRKKGASLKAIDGNLIDAIWQDQPERPKGKVKVFPSKIAGISVKQKIKNLVAEINDNNAQAFILALPDSIAWLLNVRGSDIDYIPSVLSYLLVSRRGNVRWFVDPEKLSKEVRKAVGKNVMICAPRDMSVQFMALAQTSSEKERPVLMDMRHTPIQLKKMLEYRGAIVKDHIDPTIAPKARKTEEEATAIKKAHIEDGVALVKFLKWLEENGVGESEMSVTEKLEAFRAQSNAYKGNSFPTIAGFGSNGAIVHYRADEKTNATLENGNLLLIDSGGQYAKDDIYGTTDITRTIAIGEPAQDMRERNTRVLKGHIGVAQARFPRGTVGAQIDALARKPLWDADTDFAHGTGHGVGCYLAVHEDAANISPRGQTAFERGMLISNEPGYYEKDAYGIRIENLVMVHEQGHMLYFETISYAPLDKNLIVVSMLSEQERTWVNEYHHQVYEKLSPLLDEVHEKWLRDKTQPL